MERTVATGRPAAMGAIGRMVGAWTLAAALVPAGGVARAEPVQPPDATLRATLGFDGDLGSRKAATSISGIACAMPPGAPERACLLVGDEPGFAWRVTLGETRLRLDGRITLRKDGPGELDLEAAAFARGADGRAFYYVTGSHGAKREEADAAPGPAAYDAARYRVFRIPVDPGTGAPTFADPGGRKRSGAILRSDRLERAIAAVPELKAHLCVAGGPCRALARGGVTIEGLAARDGALYFGLRAPEQDGRGFVLKVAAAELFADEGPLSVEVLHPELGDGIGIRDLTAVEGGFLILAGMGPSDTGLPGHLSVVRFWDGVSSQTVPLARIVTGREARPEALVVVRRGGGGQPYELLVLSDGPKKGDPRIYSVPAP